MKVLKFGGSSVADAERIRLVQAIFEQTRQQDGRVAVVVSALGGITDKLIDTARLAKIRDKRYLDSLAEIETRHLDVISHLVPADDVEQVVKAFQQNLAALSDVLKGIYLLKELSRRTLDQVCAFGEMSSAFIISKSLGERARFLDARNLVRTDSHFGNARVSIEETYANIQQFFQRSEDSYIITGFIARNEREETTTLGRGGSDYTAALFGAALQTEAIEIWSDVDGVLTADPRKVRQAIALSSISYEEAMEMSHFGAKIIYPPTLQPAIEKQIPIYIRNTFNPDFPGTLIDRNAEASDKTVKGISSIDDVALLKLQGSGMIGVSGISGRLFRCLAKAGISIILITQASSEHSICFAIRPSQADRARTAIRDEFELELRAHMIDQVIVETELSILAIVGENMRRAPGVAGKFFTALGKNGVNVVAIAQGSSELNLSAVIGNKDLRKALNVVHEAFFLSDKNVLNLFMVGVGLIGKTLMKQVQEQASVLAEEQGLELRFAGLANSRKFIIEERGIDMKQWEQQLLDSDQPMSFEAFTNAMYEANLRNSVFLDCTANPEIVDHYKDILPHSISIVTPNKIANSIDYDSYAQLKQLADRHNVQYKYETTVGAGLPVITTLRDLMHSGDRILKIEAVLSGTLSYIFNSFDGSRSFSEVVAEAQAKGFTEPDPREDLNGKDVARKILILARESGWRLEPDQVGIESLVSDKAAKAASIDAFYDVLRSEDSEYAARVQAAKDKGEVLRYIATLEEGQVQIGLRSVCKQHPFYGLSGSDNMIVFTTPRYKERPLVVKGPGAGAEVTAAGVFAEVLQIGNYLANR